MKGISCMRLTVEIVQARLGQGTVIGSVWLLFILLLLQQCISLQGLRFGSVVYNTSSSHG